MKLVDKLLAKLLGYEIYVKKVILNSFFRNHKKQQVEKDLNDNIVPAVYKDMVINDFVKPKELINGFSVSSNRWLDDLYKERYHKKFGQVFANGRTENVKRETERRVKEMIERHPTTYNTGKAQLDLRNKIEIDVRRKEQEEMVKQALASGEDLYRFSQHANCSKRCMPYQNRVCSMSLHGIDNTHYTGHRTEDGEKIYSYEDITNQVDRWGYKNNIIVGFNCRHFLIPFSKARHRQIDKRRVKKTYKQEQHIRELERQIINERITQYAYGLGTQESYIAKKNVEQLTKHLKDFCEKNNMPFEKDRLNVDLFKPQFTPQQNISFKIKEKHLK